MEQMADDPQILGSNPVAAGNDNRSFVKLLSFLAVNNLPHHVKIFSFFSLISTLLRACMTCCLFSNKKVHTATIFFESSVVGGDCLYAPGIVLTTLHFIWDQ